MDQTARKLAWQDVDSSNLAAVAYDKPTETICVRFANGGLYSYMGADEEMYTGLIHADSAGKYLNSVVKLQCAYNKWESETSLLNYINE